MAETSGTVSGEVSDMTGDVVDKINDMTPTASGAADGGASHPAPYRVVIERDEDGYWFVDFPDVPGCHTQARTLATARTRAREVLALYADDAATAPIVEELRLPGDVGALVDRSRVLRDRAARSQRDAAEATRAAAVGLHAAGLTLRAAGEVLGLSFQRVQQLVNEPVNEPVGAAGPGVPARG